MKASDAEIKERVEGLRRRAKRILEGDADNYDGADGARTVIELCDYIDSLTTRCTE